MQLWGHIRNSARLLGMRNYDTQSTPLITIACGIVNISYISYELVQAFHISHLLQIAIGILHT